MEINKSDSERLRDLADMIESHFPKDISSDEIENLRRIADTIERKAVSDEEIDVDPYRVTATMFKGTSEFAGKILGYKYEITFNKSLVHTGRFRAIEDGLNGYDMKEERDHYKALMEYWKSRCEAAEKVMRFMVYDQQLKEEREDEYYTLRKELQEIKNAEPK